MRVTSRGMLIASALAVGGLAVILILLPKPGTTGSENDVVLPQLPALGITIPEGYALSREDGPDFDYYRIQAGKDQSGDGLGIYVGSHANVPQPGVGASEHAGRLCGRQATWQTWSGTSANHSLHVSQAVVHIKLDGWTWTIHAMATSPDPDRLKALEGVAARATILDRASASTRESQPATAPSATRWSRRRG
jgi:hypothetical protein